jgi:hypothetical protein
MVRDTGQTRGEASELGVALDLIDNGCRVSQTFGHSHPYDLIADIDGCLVKIQVKTANTRDGANQHFIRLSDPDKYDAQNVDIFAGYAISEQEVFYIPYPEMGKRSSVTFTPLDKMGSDANRDRANHISEYTFEAALSRIEKCDEL